MKINLILLATLLLSQIVIGQNPVNSSYLFDVFTDATILMKDGTTAKAKLNYNTLDEQMVFMQDDQELAIAEPSKVKSVKIHQFTFVYGFAEAFLEVLSIGDNQVFLRHKTKLQNGGLAAGYGTYSESSSAQSYTSVQGAGGRAPQIDVDQSNRIMEEDVLYVFNEGEFYPVLTKKRLMKVFPDMKDDIENFVKNQNTDFKKVGDVYKIMVFCYSQKK
ncbi:hypothetical protein [Carboxylicivirga caseinilyticus]|uniref:hypothetical protein n=1 Tax=Carboxylicivirga caseinilyticus TaxID=3417572 RepID=UPI003D35070C|nr:hypothetical protein [Marinilabiliaceae bacterium A049]